MFYLLLIGFIGMCNGLSIHYMEVNSSASKNPPVQIICRFSPDEMQAASNQIEVTQGGLTVAQCKADTMVCTSPIAEYMVLLEAKQCVITIKDLDLFYDGHAWACHLGQKEASLKLKYFQATGLDSTGQFLTIRLLDVLTFFVVVVILIFVAILLVCVVRILRIQRKRFRQSRKGSSVGNEADPETGICHVCCPCLFSKKPKKTGYQGTKYPTVQPIGQNDPNRVPDVKHKDGVDRKKEAELACAKIAPETKEAATKHLTEFVEVRKPLISPSEEPKK